MIPDTRGGLNVMTCLSALQKAIRRGMRRWNLPASCYTSKVFHSMVCNRLEVSQGASKKASSKEDKG